MNQNDPVAGLQCYRDIMILVLLLILSYLIWKYEVIARLWNIQDSPNSRAPVSDSLGDFESSEESDAAENREANRRHHVLAH